MGTRSAIMLAMAMAFLGAAALAGNELYRWQDDRGNQVNSDRPPPAGIPYEVISTDSGLVRRVNVADPLSKPEQEAPPEESAAADNAETPASQPVKKNPKYCEQAKQNLQTLETAPRVRMRDEDGEYRYLTDDERAGQIRRARDTINVHCE